MDELFKLMELEEGRKAKYQSTNRICIKQRIESEDKKSKRVGKNSAEIIILNYLTN